MQRKKEFSTLKWIIFPANSVILAGIIAWFNLTVFGWEDGLPYSIIVAMIGVFSIIINKYTESENRSLAKAAFVFEIFLTVALVINATFSISVQRKMSVARMGETSQKETIAEIGKLKGSRTQREALKKIDKQEKSSQSVFENYEDILFWIMAGELALYAVSAFTLFAIAKLLGDSSRAIQPQWGYIGERDFKVLPDGRRQVTNSTYDPAEIGMVVDKDYEFPSSIDAATKQDHRTGRRLDAGQTTKSDSARQWRVSARKKLLEHLSIISHYHPGKWFKADLIEGGILIRMSKRIHGIEETIAETRQSDKLLRAVNRPDFRNQLIDELIHQGFPLEREGRT